MTDEVNAAVEGALVGGAARVVVNDSHSQMRNLVVDRLHPKATTISGRLKPQFMLEGIDSKFAGAFFLGYHGGVGCASAVMDHTYSPRIIFECRLNGQPVGEMTLNAALAGRYGVPVLLVSGDRTTLAEATRNLPWAIAVETKVSLSAYSADCLSPSRTCDALRAAATRALQSARAASPYVLPLPVTMEIDTQKTAHADVIELIPGCRRLGPRTVGFVSEDFAETYRTLMAIIYLGSAA